MIVELTVDLLEHIQVHGERAYPEEGAGLLLGSLVDGHKRISEILELPNIREEPARRNRYQLTPEDYIHGEDEAARRGLEVLGVFHSHPDHPSQPSEFDREWAMPWFSYLITSVQSGKAHESRSWRLSEDRSQFEEELLLVK